MKQFVNEKENVACIISAVKIQNTQFFWPQVQRIEYNVSIVIRELMSNINTLQFTHGVLSVFRKDILQKVGGFDEAILTEDFEIATRLRYNHYSIKSCSQSVVYTNAPETFMSFWRQRVRWYRGYFETMKRYYRMIGNSKYGLVGLFQGPLNIIAPIILLTAALLIGYNVSNGMYYFIHRFLFVEGFFSSLLSSLPTIRSFLLSIHFDIVLPMLFTALVAVLLAKITFSSTKDHFPKVYIILFYLFVYPLVTMAQWSWALIAQVFKVKKKW